MTGRILALESSCDESALAVFDPAVGLVLEQVHSQMAIHERHGGVVPDLATREHLGRFGPMIAAARAETGFSGVDRVAVTHGPGLAACLAIGVAAAKSLALALRVPVVGVNHLRGHAWSPFIPIHAAAPDDFARRLKALLPHLGLIVSGGNTLLVSIDEAGRIDQLATTRDDAAGEALDKGAKLLGLGYPGGPALERAAVGGRTDAFDFPRGMRMRSEPDFSFSGLKTSLRYLLEKMPPEGAQASLPDLCASYQQAAVDALVWKTETTLEREPGRFRSLGLSGGVANNRVLRDALGAVAKRVGLEFLPALSQHTGDNAGMIAFAAWVDPEGTERGAGLGLEIAPGLEIAG